jgi:hypothetical protein
MKRISFILLALLIFASCMKQEITHKIHGKWESTLSPKIILNFGIDDSLMTEIFTGNRETDKRVYRYETIGETTAKFSDESTGARTEVVLRVENEDKLRLDCTLGKHADGKLMIDPPNICLYYEFRKAKE